jgi:hypothetical protein
VLIAEGLELAKRVGVDDMVQELETVRAKVAEVVTRIETCEQRLASTLPAAPDHAELARVYLSEAEAVVKQDPALGHHLADKALLHAERSGQLAMQGNAYAVKATVALAFRNVGDARDFAEHCLARTTEPERSSLAALMPHLLASTPGH